MTIGHDPHPLTVLPLTAKSFWALLILMPSFVMLLIVFPLI
jgi:hypothetical protein